MLHIGNKYLLSQHGFITGFKISEKFTYDNLKQLIIDNDGKVLFGDVGLTSVRQSFLFTFFSYIKELTFHDDLEEIMGNSFNDIEDLHIIYFGKKLKNIGTLSFNRCRLLKNIVFHKDSVEKIKIKYGAFSNCGFKKVFISKNIKNLSGFNANHKLSELEFEKGSICVSIDGFRNAKIKELFIPKGIRKLQGFDDSNVEHIIFEEGSNLKKISGFAGTKKLKEVIFPKHVNSVCGFFGSGVNKIVFKKNEKPKKQEKTLKIDGFGKCLSLKEIVFEDKDLMKDISGFQECKSLKSFVVDRGVKRIRGFIDLENLSYLRFEKGENLIISGFSDCNKLKGKIKIERDIRYIGSFLFCNCKQLKEVEFCGKVDEICGAVGKGSDNLIIKGLGDQKFKHIKKAYIKGADKLLVDGMILQEGKLSRISDGIDHIVFENFKFFYGPGKSICLYFDKLEMFFNHGIYFLVYNGINKKELIKVYEKLIYTSFYWKINRDSVLKNGYGKKHEFNYKIFQSKNIDTLIRNI